jgi:hypothetical protein
MREWNTLWMEVVEDDVSHGAEAYVTSVHNMIIASINWVEAHPELSELTWNEKNKRDVMRRMGVEDSVDEDDVMLGGPWHTFFKPHEATKEWFDVMITATGHTPTIVMMEKAIACGVLIKRIGWEKFNIFMSGHPIDMKAN